MKLSTIGTTAAFMLICHGCVAKGAIYEHRGTSFRQEGVARIIIDYDGDQIQLLNGEEGQILLSERMNSGRARYQMRTRLVGGELRVTEGRRPPFGRIRASLEMRVPPSFAGQVYLHSTSGALRADSSFRMAGSLKLHTTSGPIRIRDLSCPDVTANSTSGSVEAWAVNAERVQLSTTRGGLSLQDLRAGRVVIQNTSAETRIEEASGTFEYVTKSGKLWATAVAGSGSFEASGDGSMNLQLSEVHGNLSLRSKNGDLNLGIPSGLSCKLNATTDEGSLSMDHTPGITRAPDGRGARGQIGADPTSTVTLHTRNGAIRITR